MTSYLSRRSRWWKTLKILDPSLDISESLRTTLTLDLAGLSRQEKLMIMTSTANVMDENMVHRALIRQHGQAHMRETDRHAGRGYKPTAHTHTQDWEWEPWHFDTPASPGGHDDHDNHAYYGDGEDNPAVPAEDD